VRPALRDPLVLVVARSDRELAKSLPARPRAADIADLPFLVESQKSGASRLIEAWFARQSVRLKPAMELGSVEAVRNAIAAGLGISILPVEVTLGHAGEDFVTRTLSPALARELALVYRPEKADDPALQAMCAAIEAMGDLAVP
jgi:DNA-binding transcriptional LysR family regulator